MNRLATISSLALALVACATGNNSTEADTYESVAERYCAFSDDANDDGSQDQAAIGLGCPDAPNAEVLYSASQLGVGTDVLPGTISLAGDDRYLYVSFDSRDSASGTFRLEKDGSQLTALSDVVLVDLVVVRGQLYGVSSYGVSGSVTRVDLQSGGALSLGDDQNVDGLTASPDGRLFVLRDRNCIGGPTSEIAGFDPDSGIFTRLVSDRCISSFAAGRDRIAWIEREHDQERVGIANVDGTASTVLVDPPFEVDLASVHVAGGFVYFQAEPAFPDADIARIPITGGTPQCVAHVGVSADATRNAEFFSIGSPNGPPGCLVRYDEAGNPMRLAQVRDNAINSELVIDDEHVYAVSLTADGPIVLRMPSR